MSHPLDAMLCDPWRLLEHALDGPLHPGGADATDALLDRADVGEGTRVLDVGCGSGSALRLARRRGARAIGLDRQPTEAGMVRGDLTAFPFRPNSFDVVLGECVLCLSPDLERTLDDVGRLLKPGGRLALSDVTITGEPPALPAPIDELLCLDGPRERTWICRQISQAGFEINGVQTHREDLLSMRDRLSATLDFERLQVALGDRGTQLRDGASELEAAVKSGRIGYCSVVATRDS
ncbi:class I SAM-dependent methyltransferase [Halalkalicoccus sp. GCM10025322]|uniref:class I SAM-dependent methyltransferase n=1 Tax=Halalkalicoccus TaxID=332246 RepID=UPI002F966471